MKHKKNDHYLKLVEWSEEDHCYIGTAPGFVFGGIHGKDQKKVFGELCQVVDETIRLLEKEGKPLPEPTAIPKQYSGKILLRLPQNLHKALWIKAFQEDESMNQFIQNRLLKALG